MSMWQDYLARVEKDLQQLRSNLEPLVSGQMKLGARALGGEWSDVTQERIDHIKSTIETYERIAAAIQKRVPF